MSRSEHDEQERMPIRAGIQQLRHGTSQNQSSGLGRGHPRPNYCYGINCYYPVGCESALHAYDSSPTSTLHAPFICAEITIGHEPQYPSLLCGESTTRTNVKWFTVTYPPQQRNEAQPGSKEDTILVLNWNHTLCARRCPEDAVVCRVLLKNQLTSRSGSGRQARRAEVILDLRADTQMHAAHERFGRAVNHLRGSHRVPHCRTRDGNLIRLGYLVRCRSGVDESPICIHPKYFSCN